jgi:hypothetical protein
MTMAKSSVSTQSATSTAKTSTDLENKIVCWYHPHDVELVSACHPHIQLLGARFPRLQLHYYCPPEKPLTREMYKYHPEGTCEREQQEAQEKYERTLYHLEHAVLFLPCVSTEYMLQFWQKIRSDARLSKLLLQPRFAILPLPMRAVAGAKGDCLPQPLAAYSSHEREAACAQIAEAIEQVLCDLHHEPEHTLLNQIFGLPEKSKRFTLFSSDAKKRKAP